MTLQRPLWTFLALVALTPVLLLAGPASAVAGEEERARKLAELRSEVEELSDQLEEQKADERARLRALRAQRADLEARISREQIRQAQAEGRVEEAKAELRAEGFDAELVAATKAGAASVEAAVRSGIPFRVEDRVEALNEVLMQVEAGELTPEKAVSRLWGAVEDELRLGAEIALHRQPIVLDGSERLVEVAHVGFVTMYFKTEDGGFGVAERASDGWTFRLIEERTARTQLDDLFSSLRRGVREGWFTLPAAPGGAS